MVSEGLGGGVGDGVGFGVGGGVGEGVGDGFGGLEKEIRNEKSCNGTTYIGSSKIFAVQIGPPNRHTSFSGCDLGILSNKICFERLSW